MRRLDARLTMATGCALFFLSACSDTRGLSARGDGSVASTGGATSGTGGAIPGTGGSSTTATGGSIATGGAAATGGSRSGGITGSGGMVGGDGGSVIDAGATQDASRDFICPAVCEIYCAYGNEVDGNGCELCKCKPAPVDAPADTMSIDSRMCPTLACPPIVCAYGYAKDSDGCTTCKCNPDPTVCPAIKCNACSFGYLKDSSGCDTCNCAPDPGTACSDMTSESVCTAASARCRWLVRGCSEPALPATGCYDKTLIDCTSTCPSGTTCLQRSINPCYNLRCAACDQSISICL